MWGSSQFAQLLLSNVLTDKLWLIIPPLTPGKGKILFGKGAIPAAFTLKKRSTTKAIYIFATHIRAGDNLSCWWLNNGL